MSKTRIVVLGGGYGGLSVVTRIQNKLGVNEAEITLVNKNDYHYETTWLHEASAGTIKADAAMYGINTVIKNNKVNFIKATAEKVDPENKKVILSTGEIAYDYLVIALGGESETFGIQGLKEHAFSITNINASRQIREHIEAKFAEHHKQPEKDITIVVGGAGFTGIEFLGELVNRIPKLCKDYAVDQNKVKVVCVEAAPMVLPGFDPTLVEYAVNYLKERGVTFRIKQAIKECTKEGILVAISETETEFIEASTVIWAAGVRGNTLIETSGFEAMRGRIKVTEHLTIPAHDDIFVVGDCALIINEETNRPYPPTAQIAMQQGAVCAKNLIAKVRNEELTKFVPNLKGSVCSLGSKNAIGLVFNKKITGYPASIVKKMVDNKALYQIGGMSLVLKKGKFNIL